MKAIQIKYLTAYCEKYDWAMPKGIGSIPNGDYVVTLEVTA